MERHCVPASRLWPPLPRSPFYVSLRCRPAAVAGNKYPKDFRTQRAAQIFFLRHGGPRYDPDRFDGDDDGIACEDNRCPCYYKKRLPHRHRISALPLEHARLA